MPYIMLVCLSLLWGTSFLFIKVASRSFDPFGFAFGRVGVGAAALLLAAIVMGSPWPKGRLWLRLTGMALVGQAIPFLLLGAAARLTTSADMALMMGGAPIFTFGLARLFGQAEVWNLRAALGLACGFTGVAVSLASPTTAALALENAHSGWGRGLALVAALSYATGALMSREASREVGPAMAATGSMMISTTLLFALWVAVDGVPQLSAVATTPATSWAALAALGVFNTALAYFVYFRLIETSGATFAALNNYVVPFIGLFAGAALLGEPVGLSSWIGLALVMGGVVLTGTAANASQIRVQLNPNR